MTPHIPIPNATSQRAHAAAGHIARIKSAATGVSTEASLRAAIAACDLVMDEVRALKGELRLVVKVGV